MNWFLDMNIIVYYSLEMDHSLEKKARIFVKNKGHSKFILCEYIQKDNLPKWLKRQEEILRRFNLNISGQQIEESKVYLFGKDKIFLNRLILMYENSKDKNKFKINLNKIFNFLRIKIKLFLEKYIDKFVIPIKDIDPELQSSLNTYLQNISDAKTIASGIQEHQENKLILITADKKDWNKENLEWSIPPTSNLEKNYPSLPKIEYLQNFN
ncbi:MAG: hypothetical protein IIA85_00325 [Nanoarchaeota archaeon]|nr:hypothetical protein [Nanoarchaeota archaeon]